MHPLPAANEIHWWRVPLDRRTDSSKRTHSDLSEDEQQRCARLSSEDLRNRYMNARCALRAVLGRYLRCPARDIRFRYSRDGKPSLAYPAGIDLQFNVSHSHDLAVLAFAVNTPVGIDLEHIRPQPEWLQIARRYYSASELALVLASRAEDRLRTFLQIWTFKESYVKATGAGLGDRMHGVSSFASMAGERAGRVCSEVHGMVWQIQELDVGDRYVAALSVPRRSGAGVRILAQHEAQIACTLAALP